MKNSCENDRYVSTPERKKEYIHRWLQDNPHPDACFTIEPNEQTPPGSPKNDERCVTSFAHPLSPAQGRRHSTSCTPTKSPILSGKRLASSPIFGGKRRSMKRLKVAKRLNTTLYAKETESSKSKLQTVLQSKTDANTVESDETFFENNITVASTVKANESDLNLTCGNSTSIDIIDTTDVETKNLLKVPKLLSKAPDALSESQVIESVSSEGASSQKTELNVEELCTDTDKTVSDLIEDISTQIVLVSPDKPNQVPLSQKISNPSSSNSSESVTEVHISESTAMGMNTNYHSLVTDTQTDPIDSVSTLESKVDFGKVSYILQHTIEKPKKKRNVQKGGLLDTLLTTMAKEKSNVNIFRHQLIRGASNISERPFILLQIVQHLPMMNDSQFLKCVLIEDSMDLLSGLLKNENRFISVINVPEISCIVNNNEKPVLKVYEPWTIIDSTQTLLHITRFIAVPSNSKDCDILCESICKKDLKSVREFHCPCMDENNLSNQCEVKFKDCPHNVIKMIFNYSSK